MSPLAEGEFIAAARWRLACAQQYLDNGQISLATGELERAHKAAQGHLASLAVGTNG